MTSSQPRLMESVIRGKKGWGLWLDQWTDGITEWSFTREEIFEQFSNKGIIIPESFIKDFDNRLRKKKDKRNQEYLDVLENNKNNKMIVDETGIRHDLMDESGEKVRNAMNMDKIAQIKILASQYPNDQEFGSRVRALIEQKS